MVTTQNKYKTEGVQIPVPGIGSIAWPVGYYSTSEDLGLDGRFASFEEFSRHYDTVHWDPHYSIPSNQPHTTIELELTLERPYRESGFESVYFWWDLCATGYVLVAEVSVDGEQNLPLNSLHIPQQLIEAFKEILIEVKGDGMWIFYGCEREERDDNRKLRVDIDNCPAVHDPDGLLHKIAIKLGRLFPEPMSCQSES